MKFKKIAEFLFCSDSPPPLEYYTVEFPLKIADPRRVPMPARSNMCVCVCAVRA